MMLQILIKCEVWLGYLSNKYMYSHESLDVDVFPVGSVAKTYDKAGIVTTTGTTNFLS